MKHALARVNLGDHGLILLRLVVKDLSLLLVGLVLPEVEWKPMSEFDTIDRLSHTHFLECS